MNACRLWGYFYSLEKAQPFRVRRFAPNRAFLCAQRTKIHSLRAKCFLRRTRRRKKRFELIRGFRAANSVRLFLRDIRPALWLLCESFCFGVGLAVESAGLPPAAYFLPAAAKVCKKRRLNLRFKNSLARPVPCRSLRCVPYGWKFYARGIKCSIVSAPAPLPLTV